MALVYANVFWVEDREMLLNAAFRLSQYYPADNTITIGIGPLPETNEAAYTTQWLTMSEEMFNAVINAYEDAKKVENHE